MQDNVLKRINTLRKSRGLKPIIDGPVSVEKPEVEQKKEALFVSDPVLEPKTEVLVINNGEDIEDGEEE